MRAVQYTTFQSCLWGRKRSEARRTETITFRVEVFAARADSSSKVTVLSPGFQQAKAGRPVSFANLDVCSRRTGND